MISRTISLAVLLAIAVTACKDNNTTSGTATQAPATAAKDAPAPDSAPTGNIYDAASKGTGFVVGNMMAVRQVYVFFDPQCPHCGHLWELTKPLANQVKITWMPVGFISPKSTPQGAALLASSDPVSAMDAHESSLLAQKGGLIPPDNLPAELSDKVKANTKLWQQLGGEAVPYIVFKNAATGEPGKFAGAPDTETLKKMFGI